MSRIGSLLRDIEAARTSQDARKKQRERDAAERNILDQLRATGGLGGTVPEPVTATGQPTFGFSKNLAGISQTPVRESVSFQEKQLNLAAADDRLSEFLAPAKPAKGTVTSTGGVTRTIDPSTGLQRGVDIGTPTGKAPTPSRRIYSKRVDGKLKTKTVDESSQDNVTAATEAGFQPHVAGGRGGGTPELTPSKSLKRITLLKGLKLKIDQFGAGDLDPLVLSFLKDSPDLLAILQGGDKTEAIEAIDNEIRFHNSSLPEHLREKKESEFKQFLSP